MTPQRRVGLLLLRSSGRRKQLRVHSRPHLAAGAWTVNLVSPDPAGWLALGLGYVLE